MRLKLTIVAVAASLALWAAPASALCQEEYLGGAAPQMTRVNVTVHIRELCFDAFAVGHSSATRTPVWSAEHLTEAEVDAARTLPRRDRFHAERQLPTGERAELADYVRSGFDRGHMTPSGDMPTPQAQAQSFTLANMAPQVAALNRGLWEEIEETTRELAEQDGDLFVVTGPIFASAGASLRGRVRVPVAMYKAIYDPRRRQAGAYVADNASPSSYRVVSIVQLRQLIGFDVFPSLPERVKARAMALPVPGRRQVASADMPVAR